MSNPPSRNPGAIVKARTELRRGEARSDRLVAQVTGVDPRTVRRARWKILRDMRARAVPCKRCGVPYVPTPRRTTGGKPRVYCSASCRDMAFNEQRRADRANRAAARRKPGGKPPGPRLPQPPANLARGRCVTCPPASRHL